MPKIAYTVKKFQKKRLEIIERANSIIEEYEAKGYNLTIRQLYYQFVARGLIPNTLREYSRIQSTMNDARLVGMVDWDAIVDRTREMQRNGHWDSPRDILQSAATAFKLDTRATQKTYMEVWIEKDALVGVIENVCKDSDVPYLSCRGYISQSVMWRAAMRMIDEEDEGKKTLVIQLSDLDPSGVDMTGDIQRRFIRFGSNTEVLRIALTMEQVEKYNPPPNPAKTTDTRFDAFIREYGEESWELDALEPEVITQLVQKTINKHTNKAALNKLMASEEDYKDQLQQLADDWEE